MKHRSLRALRRLAETLVRDALARATDDLAAPLPRFTAAAATGGRRLRRRRRALTAAGALCAAAVVAVPVGVSLGGTGVAGSVATDPTPTVNSSPTASGDPTPTLVDNDARSRMPAPEMLDVLHHDLEPLGLTTTDEVLTNIDDVDGVSARDLRGWLEADLVRDGRTVGGVNVVLYVTGLEPDQWTCPGNFGAPTVCDEVRDDTGEVIGRRSTSTQGDVVTRAVVVQRRNGGFVYVASSNSAVDKPTAGSPVAGPTPPLSLDQLQDIAEDDAWISWKSPASR